MPPSRFPRLLSGLLGLSCATLAAQEPVPTFNRDVRPILSENCYRCHGPDANQRQAGLRLDRFEGATAELESGRPALVPGDPAASQVLERVRSGDPDFRMPPPSTDKRLSPEQADVLERWIAAGAGYEPHWAFVTPERPALPEITDAAWPDNAVDAFVLARLEREGLKPSPPADRTTLLRRATLDVTGLPPTPAEIDAFLADDAPGAWDRVLDRLFASPRHGEHMARYWLDAARYGDTHGYHLDNVRSLWPWRDWVIAAFQENMPFDDFTVEQLAGDLLPDATRSQRVATGFHRSNPTTGEGGLIAEEYLVKYAVDRVNTTATVWMGLTAGCAQCHDHKFDPLTQREYYGLFDFFHSFAEQASDENALTPKPALKVPSPGQQAELQRLGDEIAGLRARLDAPDPELDRAHTAWQAEQTARLEGRWRVLRPASALSRGGATLRVLDDHSVLAEGHSPERDVYEIVARTDLRDILGLRLEALLDDEGLGPGRASHDNIVLSTLSVEAAPAGAPLETAPVSLRSATADYNQRDFDVSRCLDDDPATGWAFAGPGRDHDAVFAFAEPVGHDSGTLLRIRLDFTSDYPHHTLRRLRLSVSADPRALPVRLGAWHAIGPFPAASARAAHDEDFGPETNPDLAASCGGLSWSAKPEWRDGAVHELPGKVAATYLQRAIHSPEARPLRLSLGSDDSFKLWRNGELVLDRDVARPVAPDQDQVTVWLEPGENRLLWKIANHGAAYGFFFRVRGEDVDGLPAPLTRAILEPDEVSAEAAAELRAFYRRHFSTEWKALEQRMLGKEKERADLEEAVPRTMVVAELDERRQTHFLVRGQYDNKGEPVTAHVPAFLPPLPEGVEADRLALARWLVSPEHPLTARVTVNRLWQQVFGTGIVKTTEDFGSQGEWPSHPDLLDWLAVELVESGWDLRHVLRLILESATYRQDSRPTPELLARDPGNRLLARGPRFRLDAEAIRDQALFVSGLLVERVGGPSVKPYQPPGIWKAVGYTSSNTANFRQDDGDALWRRSMYTFWKRTAPPPTMALFDAPSRESCVVRRARTNTPLQALALLNDVQFVEAARHLAVRMLREGGESDAQRLAFGFRLCTARLPAESELAALLELLRTERERFARSPDAAAALLEVGDSPVPEDLDREDLAALTLCANALLNLDEVLTKG